MEDSGRRKALKVLARAVGGAAVAAVGGGGLVSCGSGNSPANSALTGRLVSARDTEYAQARQAWDRLFVTFPLAIVFAQHPQDIINAIAWCRRNDVPFRARSGRHSLEGWSSVDGGVVIDVSDMKQLTIDPDTKTAVVQTGLNQGEVVAALGRHGLALPVGSEATVGVGGVTLGGGIGYLSRHLGLTCDSLTGVDIVVPSGNDSAALIRADENQHSDLLWACRGGGGGNFGIATSYTFRLHDLTDVVHFILDWDFASFPAVMDVWQNWMPTVDNRLGSTLVVLAKTANVVEVEGYFIGSEKELLGLLTPLLAVGTAQKKIGQVNYAAQYAENNAGPREFDNWKFSSSWVYEPLPPQAVDIIMKYMSLATAPGANYWCLGWGGATRNIPSADSAFYHRNALYYAEPGAGWNGDAISNDVQAWLHAFSREMRPFVQGAYVNVPDANLQDWGNAYYGANYARLRQVKKTYDPLNFFHFPQSIPSE